MTRLAFLRNRLRPQRQAAATLIYLHVPKTAGQSLLNAAAWQYRPVQAYFVDATDPIGGIAAFRALPQVTRDGYRFIGGHAYYGMHRLLRRPAVYAALLRDPLRRTVSYYRYLQSRPDLPGVAERFAARPDLRQFLGERLGGTEMDNGQTRRLAGLYREPYGAVTAAHLTALERVINAEFLLVGLQERFDESLLLLADGAGWGLPFYVRRNTTPPFVPLPSLTPAVQELIDASNGVDQRLYDFAAERLSLRIAAGGDAFQRRLANFRRLNGLFGRIYRLLRTTS